jgi:hypothetical protein
VKKHLLLVVYVLLLCSCTSVDDFGIYWDKGFHDPSLEGSWKKIGIPGQNIDSTPGADQLVFTTNDGSYAMQAINPIDSTLPDDAAEQRKKDNAARFALRSLRIGRFVFMMIRGDESRPNGMIQRYAIKGDVLEEYYLENGRAVDLLEAKYPAAKNIRKNRGEGRFVVINTFDDEVFRILSEMAANPAYWQLQCQYRKAS